MLDAPQNTLRVRLRVETAADHDRVDAAFGALNLQDPSDLARFFAAHLIGFRMLRNAMVETNGRVGQDMVDEMCGALSADLGTLDHPTALPVIKLAPVSPYAIDHIVLGSRLGTAVLKRDWEESENATVNAASAHFTLPARPDLWRAHCEEMTAMPEDCEESNRIVADTRRLFQTFERTLDALD